jgi:hypothetical protein
LEPTATKVARAAERLPARQRRSRQPAAVETILHNLIRQTPSPINVAACQEAGDVRGAVPRPAVPGRLDHVERIGVAAAQKRRPAGRLAARCRQDAGATGTSPPSPS